MNRPTDVKREPPIPSRRRRRVTFIRTTGPTTGLLFTAGAVLADLQACLQVIHAEVERRGGAQPYPGS